jgi:ABC-type polysaccharide/polyol phosphate transport system ATPase subunit
MSQEIAIQASKLSKTYKLFKEPVDRLKEALHPFRKKYHTDFHALSDVTFDVYKGETLGIIGKNGAGKSTLLKILTGVLTPSSGTYSVRGRISSLLELGTGFNPELSGIENVFFNGMLLNIPREELEHKLSSILAFADIGEFIEQPVKVYSSGMFARLAFAVAFHVDPDILIVDEALSVGDMAFQKKCFDKFHEIRSKGSTILFVSHDPFQVKGYCQRALYLKNGEVVIFGNSSDVVDAYSYDQESEIRAKANKARVIKEETKDQSDAVAQSVTENSNNHHISITGAKLTNLRGEEVNEIMTGQSVTFSFTYKVVGDFQGKISFVFNLYKHDDFYVCGATSVMDKIPAHAPGETGEVQVKFDNLQLLAGKYKWRCAINDEEGLGIYTEAVPVCEFSIKDNFESVGLINLNRSWKIL